MQLGIIFARAANGVIGKDNKLPWHLPEDMAHFKRTTLGAPVIMGRKTWDSLPPRFRPLPGRRNIVITRQAHWQVEGVERCPDLGAALRLCVAEPRVWVIGGAQVYAEAEPLADVAAVTEIESAFEGDAYAPQFGPGWVESARERHVSVNGLAFSFVTYTRNKGS